MKTYEKCEIVVQFLLFAKRMFANICQVDTIYNDVLTRLSVEINWTKTA